MTNEMDIKLQKFAQMIETFEEKFGKFDAAACVRCIQIAENEMKAGKYSVEAFLKAKEILLKSVECNGLLN